VGKYRYSVFRHNSLVMKEMKESAAEI
jgi:hypothetical protein